jgi:hypothetical protein
MVADLEALQNNGVNLMKPWELEDLGAIVTADPLKPVGLEKGSVASLQYDLASQESAPLPAPDNNLKFLPS